MNQNSCELRAMFIGVDIILLLMLAFAAQVLVYLCALTELSVWYEQSLPVHMGKFQK